MTHTFTEFSTGAILKIGDISILEQYQSPKQLGLFTFIKTEEEPIEAIIDSIPTTIQKNQVISLTTIQHFQLVKGEKATVYQFNREFYCIKDHDKEVSCVGLLFYGSEVIPVVDLSKEEIAKLDTLQQVFMDELATEDSIQAEMLRMLMARFIITITRLLKTRTGLPSNKHQGKIDLLRQFNLLVDTHYKKEHSVSFYAEKLFKSSKTLSNSFSNYGKSPLQIIHSRIVLEAKRLLYYTDMTTKEIAYSLGFEDASHLSRLFKKQTGHSPSSFKSNSNI